MKRSILLLMLLLGSTQLVLAQSPTTNDYFGGMMPGGNAMGVGNGDPDAPQDSAGSSSTGHGQGMPKVGDLTGDERRMRKKYTSNVQHAKDLILRGQEMEKKGKADGDPKLMKRGKIYQEIGKKALGDLEASIPAPDADLVREKKERDSNPTRL